MKHLIPFLMIVALVASVVVAQNATQTQGGRAGGIAKLLQQVDVTPEQWNQINDARFELQNATNPRAALQEKLKEVLSGEQYQKFEQAWKNRGKNTASAGEQFDRAKP